MENTSRRQFIKQGGIIATGFAFSDILKLNGNKKPTILVVSGWQDVNIGDIGHTPGLLAILQKHMPTAKLILWKVSPSEPVEQMLGKHFPSVQIIHGSIKEGLPAGDDVKKAFEKADILIHGSGPWIVKPEILSCWHAVTKKPYGIFGVTQQEVSEELKPVIANAAFLFTRETTSLYVLAGNGFTGEQYAFVPDATFGISIHNEEKAASFLKSKQLDSKKFICVVPRLRKTPYYKMKANSGWSEGKIREVNELNDKWKEIDHAKLREAMIRWVRETQLKILVCPEVTYQVDIMNELLIDPLPDDVKPLVLKRGYWLTDEAASVYKQAFAVVSFECHSPIIALANGVPAIHLRQLPEDTIKGQMYNDLGFNNWVFDINQCTGKEIGDTLMSIYQDNSSAKKNIRQSFKFIHQRFKYASDVILSSLAKKMPLLTLFLAHVLLSPAQMQKIGDKTDLHATGAGQHKTAVWRSILYPENWQPGYSDTVGRFLHDFSYAGYHSGLAELPQITGPVFDISKKPYYADRTGVTDVTKIVQRAIDNAGKKGGGVIFFPEGEYKLSVSDNAEFGLRIKTNHIVLRGAGTGKTFLKNVSTKMHLKRLIEFKPSGGDWQKPVGQIARITKDLMKPTTKIPVDNAKKFKAGDLIIIMTDCTDEFIKEHKSEGQWSTKIRGVRFCRFVKTVDAGTNEIEVDAPTRYYLKKRDNARVFRIGDQLQECGMEDMSVGNIQNEHADLWQDPLAFRIEGTGPYEVHNSHLIEFKYALNCWVKNVATYRPKENTGDFHTMSNCFRIVESRFITVEKCNFKKTQYKGGGGNGYMYTLEGNDCLLKDCYAEDGRHNYSFKEMSSNGNVILNCVSKDPLYASDFHMWLSMANLFDSFISDGDYIEAAFRPYGPKGERHMYTTTESVMWNTKGLAPHVKKYLIDSRQWGWGYVIGTSGPTCKVLSKPVADTIDNLANGYYENQHFDTAPEDFIEGEAKGDGLVPQSLYLDQLEKRKIRLGISGKK